MKSHRLLLLGALAIGAVILGGIASLWARRTPVDVERVSQGPIAEFVDEQAVTRLAHTYAITMPIAGRIEPITLEEGAAVRRGEVVARIVPDDLELEVAQAQALVDQLGASIRENADVAVELTAVRQAQQYVESMKSTVEAAAARAGSSRAAKEFSDKHLARVQNLFAARTASEEDLDQATLQQVQSDMSHQQDQLVRAALVAMQAATNLMPLMVQQYIQRKALREPVLEKQRAQAQTRLEQMRLNRQRGTMTSPVDGVVLTRAVSNERYLAPGATLLEIGRLEDLEAEADVLSVDVSNVRPGQRARLYGASIGEAVWGQVHRVYPAGFTKVSSLGVEQQRVKVVVRFEPADLARLLREKRLGVGYRVRVQIVTRERSATLSVPRAALFRDPTGRWEVYVVRRGRTLIQPVEVGLLNDERAEILKGLEAGELVVRTPESSLMEGVRVRPTERDPQMGTDVVPFS